MGEKVAGVYQDLTVVRHWQVALQIRRGRREWGTEE